MRNDVAAGGATALRDRRLGELFAGELGVHDLEKGLLCRLLRRAGLTLERHKDAPLLEKLQDLDGAGPLELVRSARVGQEAHAELYARDRVRPVVEIDPLDA